MFDLGNLKTSTARRVFLFVSILIFIIEIIALVLTHEHYKNVPEPYSSIVKEVLINLVAATISAVILLSILIYLIPIERHVGSIEALDSRATKSLHNQTLKTTHFWLHNGHFGRWVRTEAMPYLATLSKENGITTEIKLIILNPTDNDVCTLYMRYRKQISHIDIEIDNVRDVQAELFATILVAQRYNQATDHDLVVKIYLNSQFNLVREDINESVVFRTQVDPKCSAVVYYNKDREHDVSEFYYNAKKNFNFTAKFCQRVPFEPPVPMGELTVENVKTYLNSINLLSNCDSDDDFIKKVIKKAHSTYNPYESQNFFGKSKRKIDDFG
ncbi:hypothetical protein GCM10028808_73620 [Spirosoma migulaei]|uniref:Uncharacterized protein n=1 Tax=Spirosoma foliorum TaxID=2710596 RepID=A0A7G5H6E7_9BACT|nr:hypothetical protein [Spirosoma foliorum]QMW06689.1 hypothetical protein H3H32_18255 [Spirosoma foliorum]